MHVSLLLHMAANKVTLIGNTHFTIDLPYLVSCYSCFYTLILDNFILKWQGEGGGR